MQFAPLDIEREFAKPEHHLRSLASGSGGIRDKRTGPEGKLKHTLQANQEHLKDLRRERGHSDGHPSVASPANDRRHRVTPAVGVSVELFEKGTTMTTSCIVPSERYARCIASSKRVRWDIDADVIRGRSFDRADKFLPDGLTLACRLDFLSSDEKVYFSQVQGRTYANMFGLVERFIGAKVLELSGDYWLGDQVALEALVRFGDEELKHQALFRRIEALTDAVMPPGYSFAWEPNEIAAAVLSKSSWAVLALTLHIELFTQAHYRESIRKDPALSQLYKDVFFFHWKEECQHALIDELEWWRLDARIGEAARDKAVDELIELVGAVDGICQGQAAADADYFSRTCGRRLSASESAAVGRTMLEAYRLQYILSGVRHPHFAGTLADLTTDAQLGRIYDALTGLSATRELAAA
jgi:hypothetical protein